VDLQGRPEKWRHYVTAQNVSTGAAFAVTLLFSYDRGVRPMMLIANIALSIVSAAGVWLSARHHRVALAVMAALCLGSPVLSTSFAAIELCTVFVLYQVTMGSDDPLYVPAVVGFVSLTVNDVWLRVKTEQDFAGPTLLYPVVLTGLGVGLGMQGRRIRLQNRELVELRSAERQRAISDERRRIARDLHDVAAHHLTALVVHNKLAQRRGSPEALHEAAQFSAVTAADALESLRSVVGVLNFDDSPLSPQPSLSDLDSVFARLEVAGLHIHRSIEAFAPAPRRDVQLAVVRIATEALTNTLRHCGPGPAWVSLRADGDMLDLCVDDDGRGQGTSAPLSSGGLGIIGMTERAHSCRGVIDVGPSVHGGRRVHVRIPLETS
jgi:signal transduction histidine kinase